MDHLKLEEALLTADSYCHSQHPYTRTMAALDQQYGQPHQLALQQIAELMDGPSIASGDQKAFRIFALKVRSLVGMLEQLGRKGTFRVTVWFSCVSAAWKASPRPKIRVSEICASTLCAHPYPSGSCRMAGVRN